MPRLRLHLHSWSIICLIGILLPLGWWLVQSLNETESFQFVSTVDYSNIEDSVMVFGTLKPSRSVEVGAQVSGQLERLHVREGERVEKGDLVAQIDAAVQQSRVDEQMARIRSQEAQLVSYESKLRLAKVNSERQTRLVAADASSRAAYDRAQDQLIAWESNFVRLRSEIEQSRARLATEQALLGYSQIYAPIDGTVIEVRVSEGQTLIATQRTPVIVVIANLESMTVEASIPEADISRVRPGLTIRLSATGGGARTWRGILGQVLPTPRIEDNVVRYTTLFNVDNSDGALLPNMTAQVTIVTASALNVLTVPYAALEFIESDQSKKTINLDLPKMHTQSTAHVRRVLSDGGYELTEVSVGITNRVSAEIVEGLNSGDKVIVGSSGIRS